MRSIEKMEWKKEREIGGLQQKWDSGARREKVPKRPYIFIKRRSLALDVVMG